MQKDKSCSWQLDLWCVLDLFSTSCVGDLFSSYWTFKTTKTWSARPLFLLLDNDAKIQDYNSFVVENLIFWRGLALRSFPRLGFWPFPIRTPCFLFRKHAPGEIDTPSLQNCCPGIAAQKRLQNTRQNTGYPFASCWCPLNNLCPGTLNSLRS